MISSICQALGYKYPKAYVLLNTLGIGTAGPGGERRYGARWRGARQLCCRNTVEESERFGESGFVISWPHVIAEKIKPRPGSLP
jgi:hypothetical protein